MDGSRLTDTVSLIVDEEESLVLKDGSADSSAELVLTILALLDRVEVVARIKVVVTEELKDRTVEAIGSGLGRDEHRTSTAAAVLS